LCLFAKQLIGIAKAQTNSKFSANSSMAILALMFPSFPFFVVVREMNFYNL